MLTSRDQDENDEIIKQSDNHYKTNSIQKLLKVAYSYAIDGVVLPVVITSKCIPNNAISQPLIEVIKSGLIITCIEAADALHALTERKYPFYGLTCSVQAKKMAASFCASVIPLGCSVFIGFSIKYYGGENGSNITHMGNFSPAEEVKFVVNNPLLHIGLLSMVVYSQYGLTKLLIDECYKKHCCPESTENEKPGQNYYQILFKVATDIIEPIALYEALRMIFVMVGQKPALHHQFFPLLVVGCDQLLKFWRYMSRIPHPLNHLVPADSAYWIRHVMLEDTVGENNEIEPLAPASRSILFYAGYYSIRALFAIGIGLTAMEVAGTVRGQYDQEQLSTTDKIVNLLAITYATGIGEQMFDFGMLLGSKLSHCCATLFGGVKSRKVDELDERYSIQYSAI